MERLPVRIIIALTVLMLNPIHLQAQDHKTLDTKYSTIYYSDAKDLDEFVWHLGGERVDFTTDRGIASNRVDRIVERVMNILDMRPKAFKVRIYLKKGFLEGPNKIAYYEYRTKSIHVSVDNVTDGVLAHEIAHAIINRFFDPVVPSKVQEILTQYVDKYLWSDY